MISPNFAYFYRVDYNGARTAKAIAEAGLDRLPMNLIKQITSKSIESFYEKKVEFALLISFLIKINSRIKPCRK